jgi:hypothetical protein
MGSESEKALTLCEHCDNSTCINCDEKYEINNGLPKCSCGCGGMSY